MSALFTALNIQCISVFGDTVTYYHETGEIVSITAIFQATRQPEETVPGIYAELFIRLADLTIAPVRGDEIEIASVSYKVFDIETDSSGAAVLKLRKV